MDPNTTLDEIRALLSEDTLGLHAARSLSDLVSGLDGWLSRGGLAPAAWTIPPSSEMEGTIGLVAAGWLRVGDVFLFPAREIWAIEEDGFSIVVDDGQHTDSFDAGQKLLAFRPNHPLSRRLDGCPDCPAGPRQRCRFECRALASVDEKAHAYLARVGLTDLD